MNLKGKGLCAAVMLLTQFAALGCRPITGDTFRLEAYKAYKDKEFAEARLKFQKCLDVNNADIKSLYYMGLIDLAENNPGTAANRLELAYEIYQKREVSEFMIRPGNAESEVPFPSRHQILDACAEAMDKANSYPQLLHFLKQVSDQYHETADYIRLGKYLTKRGDPDAALAAYRAAIRVAAPTDASGHLAMADFYEGIGDREQALIQLRYAYKIIPNDPTLQDRIRKHGLVPGPTIALPQSDAPSARGE